MILLTAWPKAFAGRSKGSGLASSILSCSVNSSGETRCFSMNTACRSADVSVRGCELLEQPSCQRIDAPAPVNARREVNDVGPPVVGHYEIAPAAQIAVSHPA